MGRCAASLGADTFEKNGASKHTLRFVIAHRRDDAAVGEPSRLLHRREHQPAGEAGEREADQTERAEQGHAGDLWVDIDVARG